MQTVLGTLNSMPGVMGSMVCDSEGRVRAHSFPAPFEPTALQEMATVLTDGAVGLETVTGRIDLVDLRYGESRVFVKPMTGGLVVLLCGRAVNVPLLGISISVATRKLEKLLAPPEVDAAPAPVAEPVEIATEPAEMVGEPARNAAGTSEFDAEPSSGPAVEDEAGKKRKKPKKTWFPSV